MAQQRIVLITGERQTGKSFLCTHVVQELQDDGVEVSGLLTQHTGPHDLEVTEIRTGTRYPLTLPFPEGAHGPLKRFIMDPQAMRRSQEALMASLPTEVFVIDELGPLELKLHRGWYATLSQLKRSVYRVALLVVRPELLTTAVIQLPISAYTVVRISEENRSLVQGPLLKMLLHICQHPANVDMPPVPPRAA